MPHGKMHLKSGSGAPPGGRGARWAGDWLAGRRRSGSFNIRAETRLAWRRPWRHLSCVIGQQMTATNNKTAAAARCPASQPVGNPASAPPFLRWPSGPGSRVVVQCPRRAGLADLGISSAAQQPFRGRWPRGFKHGRAPSSSGKCPFRPRSIITKHLTRGHQRGKRLAAAGGRLSPRRRPWELGPEPAALVLSGTHLVSHPKQGKPPRCAGKLQCRLAAFRPPSSSEHRRCYTSRTLSVWSPPDPCPRWASVV